MSDVFPNNLIFFKDHNGNFKEEKTRLRVFDVSKANVTHDINFHEKGNKVKVTIK